MINKELTILLSLAKTTLKEKQEGLITSEEANRVFLQIKEKLKELDNDVSKSILDKLISRIEF